MPRIFQVRTWIPGLRDSFCAAGGLQWPRLWGSGQGRSEARGRNQFFSCAGEPGAGAVTLARQRTWSAQWPWLSDCRIKAWVYKSRGICISVTVFGLGLQSRRRRTSNGDWPEAPRSRSRSLEASGWATFSCSPRLLVTFMVTVAVTDSPLLPESVWRWIECQPECEVANVEDRRLFA